MYNWLLITSRRAANTILRCHALFWEGIADLRIIYCDKGANVRYSNTQNILLKVQIEKLDSFIRLRKSIHFVPINSGNVILKKLNATTYSKSELKSWDEKFQKIKIKENGNSKNSIQIDYHAQHYKAQTSKKTVVESWNVNTGQVVNDQPY